MNAPLLADLLRSLGTLPMMGEPVDQYEHAMQTARAALDAGADDDLVLASALHDIGRAKPVVARFPNLPHEEAGARFVAPLLGKRAAWLVREHVAAKRYLVRVEAHELSAASMQSLSGQGGLMDDAQVEAFIQHPWAEDVIALRRWDDAAKHPQARAVGMSELIAIYERCRLKLR